MTVESSLLHSDPEDIFAKAIERVEAGEPVEVVLATVPVAMHVELREILLLITATHHLQRAPVPQPAAPRRAARKAAFLQAAAQMQAEMVPNTAPAHATVKRPQASSSMTVWLQNFWRELQMGFAAPNLRLAPFILIVIAVWLGAFGFVTVTQAAELGDLVYPVKKWIEHQDLNLSSKESRGKIYKRITNRLVADLTTAADKLRAEEKRTGRKAAMISTELLIFEQTAGDQLTIGPLTVMMQYQPDPNVDVYENIHMSIMPSTDQQVELTFQIMPTADENAEPSFITQGIRVAIPADQLEIGPTPISEPTATTTPCVATQPAGWVPYAVRSGDTLSSIAQRTGTTVAQLQQANCIADANIIASGRMFFAPALQQINTPTATEQETLKVTLTAISTTTVTPSINITATASVVPTDTLIITSTETITAALTAEAMTTITATLQPTATLVETPIPSMTATVAAGETVTDTIDPAAGGTPLAPPVTATGSPEAVTPTGTVASPTSSVTPSATPTSEGMATSAPSATPTATWTPTAAPTSTENGVGESTPTSTPIPQNRSPLSGG